MINDLSTLLRLMEQGSRPRHTEDGWTIEQVDRQTGAQATVEVSTFAISQAKKFNSIEVVKTDSGYEAVLMANDIPDDTCSYPTLSSDITNLSYLPRLNSLAQTGLFGSAPAEEFDRLTRLAASVLRCPIALITLISADGQHIKSQFGLAEPGTFIAPSLPVMPCKYVAANGQELVACNVKDHKLTGDLGYLAEIHVQAYAGFPIWGLEKLPLGAFAVMDAKPRHWTRSELDLVKNFAGLADLCIEAVEMRRKLAMMAMPQSAYERTSPGAM